MADGELVTAAHIEAHAEGAGAGQARHPARRHGVDPHRLERAAGRTARTAPATTRWRRASSVDAAKLLATKRIVAIGLDAPFIDAVPDGMLQGKAPPAPGTEPGLPFSIHHYMLSVFGIHHLENLNLAAMARRPRLDLVRDGPAVARPGRRGRGDPAGRDRPARPALKEKRHV